MNTAQLVTQLIGQEWQHEREDSASRAGKIYLRQQWQAKQASIERLNQFANKLLRIKQLTDEYENQNQS